MRVLLVNPAFPITYWGFQYTLGLAGKRVNLPPLGLITVAALLPETWEQRLVDLNIRPLTAADLRWAEVVMVGGMLIQAPSIHEVLALARAAGRRTVVGGPAPTTAPQDFADADVVFCGEAEGRIDELLAVLAEPTAPPVGLAPPAGDRPDMRVAVVPRFDLLELGRYATISIQFSRGCPFACEFCDIVELFGHFPRVKTVAQILAELDALARLGFQGSVFLVDDNFIGNKKAVRELVPAIGRWQRAHGFPFELFTEVSINLANDTALAQAMVDAGFTAVFVGIETPSKSALAAAGKTQNLQVDLSQSVANLTAMGLEVMGGFIVGFDQDDPTVFGEQARFVAGSPIPMAMVGLLTAFPGTALWRRLAAEGRLRRPGNGDQFERPNFQPRMDEQALLRGYAELLAELYAPEAYYRRCAAVIRQSPATPGGRRVSFADVLTLIRVAVRIGIFSRNRRHFWRLLAVARGGAGKAIAWAISEVIKGEHLIRYTHEEVLPRIERAIAEVAREVALAPPVPARASG